MSIESAKAFVERMKNDKEFSNKVLACKTPEDRMKLVKGEGYDFSKADIKVVTAIIDDSALEQAAGGAQAMNVSSGCSFPQDTCFAPGFS